MENRMELTKRQNLVLQKIYEFISANSFPPTIRELASELGFSSPKGVTDHLDALERKGYLERQSSARSIKLTPRTMALPGFSKGKEALYLPIIGKIAAGAPIFAEENIEDYISFAPELLGDRRADFALRVRGDSMTGDHIIDGDIIAVRSQSNAGNGDIVVALLENDEAVVKRFHKNENSVELRSSNPAYGPIRIEKGDELKIQGRVIAVQRQICQ